MPYLAQLAVSTPPAARKARLPPSRPHAAIPVPASPPRRARRPMPHHARTYDPSGEGSTPPGPPLAPHGTGRKSRAQVRIPHGGRRDTQPWPKGSRSFPPPRPFRSRGCPLRQADRNVVPAGVPGFPCPAGPDETQGASTKGHACRAEAVGLAFAPRPQPSDSPPGTAASRAAFGLPRERPRTSRGTRSGRLGAPARRFPGTTLRRPFPASLDRGCKCFIMR